MWVYHLSITYLCIDPAIHLSSVIYFSISPSASTINLTIYHFISLSIFTINLYTIYHLFRLSIHASINQSSNIDHLSSYHLSPPPPAPTSAVHLRGPPLFGLTHPQFLVPAEGYVAACKGPGRPVRAAPSSAGWGWQEGEGEGGLLSTVKEGRSGLPPTYTHICTLNLRGSPLALSFPQPQAHACSSRRACASPGLSMLGWTWLEPRVSPIGFC